MFTMGLRIDEPLEMRSGVMTARFFHQDALGGALALSGVAGDTLESYGYLSYGKPFVSNGLGAEIGSESAENRILYAAREFDPEDGQYHHRRRQGDPLTGGFTQEDPIGIAGGINQFSYVANNPATWTDPSGLAQCVYSIGLGRLTCTSNDGSATASAQMFSGLNEYANDPKSTGVKDLGPIPEGNYQIRKLPGTDPRDWFLDPGLLSRIAYRANDYALNPFNIRGAFNLHLRKGGSLGCITGGRRELDKNLSDINDLLNMDGGNNSLKVGL
ncbi:MAG: hypothetical protein COV48_08960 [Elusimicrobia bacterium CG11_big_fil_rev_8_21_14_0_20_64_6]|nr:MAG: hypothetical protein COV48_08960 [Elusimicrobia bacterium CG11_big_fil_rev_8_21_14_0_20_64_6]